MGISNFASNLPGILTPLLVAAIVTEGTEMQWRYVFFISGGCFILCLIIFLLFAKGKTQEWAKDYDENQQDKGDNVICIAEPNQLFN